MYTSSTDETSFETSAVFANRTVLHFIVPGSHAYGNTGIDHPGGDTD